MPEISKELLKRDEPDYFADMEPSVNKAPSLLFTSTDLAVKDLNLSFFERFKANDDENATEEVSVHHRKASVRSL